MLDEEVYLIGSRVRVANESPLKGRKGTILAIRMTATPGEPTSCYYLVALDGAYLLDIQWFEFQEIALVGTTCEKPAEY
jgi:hypothetical protein